MKHMLALLFLSACLVSSDQTLGGVPNSRWSCTGCRDDHHRIDIFGAVHQAIHREERGAYLAVDMSWLDQILLPSASVHVTVVARDALANFVHPSTRLDERNLTAPPLPDRLVYNVVVSEVPESVRTEHRVRSRRAYFEPPPPSSLIFTGVDPFLTFNPCFMPLAEPVRSMHGKMGNVAAVGSRRKLLAEGGESGGQASEREQRGLGGRLLVLVGMPHTALHSTCQLYKAITRFQFPQKCAYTNTSMAVHELSNIGYAHTVIHFTHAFVNNLFSEGRVSIAPRPDPYYARKFIYMHLTTNEQISGFGWGWADPETCPEQTYLHDPFACNFLSLSNCSDRHRSAHLKAEDLTSWSTPSTKLQSTGPPEEPWGLGITAASREAFGDSPVFSEEEWVQSRAMAFVQRPNAYLRLLIRNSLRNIVVLGAAAGSSAEREGGASPTASQTQTLAHHATLHAQLLSPCLAMHVRHQDLYLEEHRVRLGIDRSLKAHIQHARNLTRALGLRKIFLATDNASVFEEVAGRYPEYTWLMQRRPVPQKLVMFGMFTKMYETAAIFNQTAEQRDGHSKIPGLPDSAQSHTATVQESVTATLSHILADWRAAAQCTAVVGAFDSGFTAQMYRTMCAMGRHRGVRGKCPPSFDLRNTERKPPPAASSAQA